MYEAPLVRYLYRTFRERGIRVRREVDQEPTGRPAGADAYDERATRLSETVSIGPTAKFSYGANAAQRIEIFAPQACIGTALPIVVFLHGGAWMAGGLHWLRFMAPAVTALPAVFAAVTYRLAPHDRWPAQYEDARDALLCVRRHATSFGGDAHRVVIGGHSAGGQLASMVVLRGEAGPLVACMPVSTPFDLRYGDVAEASSEMRVYKYLLRQRSDDADASPILFVAKNRTPFHLAWGGRDMPHIRKAGEAMRQALVTEPGGVTTHVYPDDDHFDTHLRLADPADDWYAQLRTLLARPLTDERAVDRE